METNSFSLNLAEEVRSKLEKHSKLLKNKRRALTRGNSFDISSEAASSSSPGPRASVLHQRSSSHEETKREKDDQSFKVILTGFIKVATFKVNMTPIYKSNIKGDSAKKNFTLTLAAVI